MKKLTINPWKPNTPEVEVPLAIIHTSNVQNNLAKTVTHSSTQKKNHSHEDYYVTTSEIELKIQSTIWPSTTLLMEQYRTTTYARTNQQLLALLRFVLFLSSVK